MAATTASSIVLKCFTAFILGLIKISNGALSTYEFRRRPYTRSLVSMSSLIYGCLCHGVRAVGRGPWAVGRGPGAVGRGPGAVGRGPWAVGRGPLAVVLYHSTLA